MRDATVVLDIGKTNAKLTLLAPDGEIIASQRRANRVLDDGFYPHLDTEGLWDWMLDVLRECARMAHVQAIVPVTHGATAALIDGQGLVLPVLDYESTLPEAINAEYRARRDSFAQTCSPDLPAGLNLGRQLAWLSTRFPAQWAHVKHILMYPQYWAWRLCGAAASEVTSLGCHTDLWLPAEGRLAPMATERLGWGALFPPLRAARDQLGVILPAVAQRTGLPRDCMVLCGIHDSNASLLRHLSATPPAVLSTGTWAILAAFDVPVSALDERNDMLANVNALGQPVACMRFMGGREFAAIAGDAPVVCSAAHIHRLIEEDSFALPCFAEAGGPFAGRHGAITGTPPTDAAAHYALATLYVALMTDYCIDRLGTKADLVVEGSFTTNPHFAPLLAALRPERRVLVSDDASGTTNGGLLLHRGALPLQREDRIASRFLDEGLHAYRSRWRAQIAS